MQMLDLFLMELSFQFYKNLANVYVEKGQKVNALQTIGITFDNDESKTTLQFSIFENTKALDPYLWIVK